MGNFRRIEQNIRRRHSNYFENRMETLGDEIRSTLLSGADHSLLETQSVAEHLVENQADSLVDIIRVTMRTQNWEELAPSIHQLIDTQICNEINDPGTEQAMARHLHNDMLDELDQAADSFLDQQRDEA